MKKLLLAVSVLLVAMTGCKRVILPTTGDVSVNLSSEGEFTQIVKSSPDEVDINTFSIEIKSTSDNKVVSSWDNFSDMPAVIAMEPGSFVIKASSPGDKEVAWNQPKYVGIQNFIVEAGKVQNLDIVCTLNNMKVTVKCTDRFLTELNDDFSIKVATDAGFLIYSKEIVSQGEAIAGYFDVAPLIIDIRGTRKLDGSVVSHYFTIDNVAARDHHIFTVDAHETGQVAVGEQGISVDYTLNNKDVDIKIGDLEEDPVEDDLTGTPVVENVSVAANAQVDTKLGLITVQYSLPVKLAENHGITLGSAAVTAIVDNKTLKITFGELEADKDYTLTIPAGAVVNSTDNSPAAAYSVSFKTKGGEVEVPITIDVPGMNECYVITDTKNLVFDLKITAEKGISNMIFEVLSESLKPLVTSTLGVDTKVDLANMSEGEEAVWGSLLKVTSAQVKGAKSVNIPLGELIALLGTGELANIQHDFHAKVVDADGNVKETDVKVKVQK